MGSGRARAGRWVLARGCWVRNRSEAHTCSAASSGDEGAVRSRSPSDSNAHNATSSAPAGAVCSRTPTGPRT
eukprot:9550745-Alexandrium_andersonii.AAC.1